MHNLLEYVFNYSETSGSLSESSKDKTNYTLAHLKLFKCNFKVRFMGLH